MNDFPCAVVSLLDKSASKAAWIQVVLGVHPNTSRRAKRD